LENRTPKSWKNEIEKRRNRDTEKQRYGETETRRLGEGRLGECNSGVKPHSGDILVARGGAKRNPGNENAHTNRRPREKVEKRDWIISDGRN
jgi:hypothetical protein